MRTNYEFYEITFRTGENTFDSCVADTYEEAVEIYDNKDGFMLVGVDAPECYEVLLARPVGLRTIS